MNNYIGCHINKGKPGKLTNSVIKLIQFGGNAFQLFVSSPSTWYPPKKIPQSDIDQLTELRKKRNIYGVVHGKYIYNFCRECTGKFSKQIDVLVDELEVANSIGCNVIIHQGKNIASMNKSRSEALKQFVENISTVLDKSNNINKIILENSCQQGTELGFSLDELHYIYNQFNDDQKKRIGFCIDLCHIFVAGELDVRKPEEVNMFFTRFDKLFGLNKLEVIHFNDSSTKFDGHNDHHAGIGNGYIGSIDLGGSMKGFVQVIKWAINRNIPMILETPSEGHIEEMKMLNKIASDMSDMSDMADMADMADIVDTKNKKKIVLKKKK